MLSGPSHAQDFPPKKPVTLVVGFAAGGAADAAARLIAKKLGENIGQTVVVDNKAGAGGNIAHQQVANGPADGTMLLLGSIGPLTIAPHVMKVSYDPFKDLAPVSGGVNFPNVLVVHKGVGVKTLAEFVALAKKKPGSRRLRVHRRRLGIASGGRTLQPARRHRDGARALQRRRAGPAGPAGRTHHRLFLGAAHGAAARGGRQARPAGHHGPDASGLHAQHSRPSRSPATPASRR